MENSNQNPNTNNPSSSSFVIKIPSYEEVIQSQSQPPAQSLFKSSQTFTQAFKSIKNSEFYVPPPSSSSSQSQPRDNNSTPSAAVNHAGASSSSTQNRNAILVSNRQKGNPLLKHIRNVRWAFSDIVCDYMLGKNSCALYLSLRYHLLHPDYLYYRIRELGKNFKLRVVLCHVDVVAPYNTFYPQLEEHMKQVGIDVTSNRWAEPIALGLVDPHDNLSHPAGVSDCQTESAHHLDPDQFTNFLIPNWLEGQASGPTKDNPFPLPDVYLSSQRRNESNLVEVKQILREAPLEDSKKKELSSALHVYFKDWLYASGNIRQLYCLQGE